MGLRTPEPVFHGPFIGPLFETAVVSAWVKAFHHRGLSPTLYYWRSRDGLEVDLLVDHDGRLYPVEAKAMATVTPQHAASLRKWRELAGQSASPMGLIAADVPASVTVAPGVRAIPWWWV